VQDINTYTYELVEDKIKHARHVLACIIFILFANVIDNYLFLFLKTSVSFIPIIIVEWLLLAFLITDLTNSQGHILLKLFLIIIAVKILFYIIMYHEFNFQKGIIIIILLSNYAYNNDCFIAELEIFIKKYLVLLVGVTIFSFVPWVWFYNRYSEVLAADGFYTADRYSGLWDLPHAVAYYFLAFIILLDKNEYIILNILLLIFIVATGVRSALIAVAVYVCYKHILIPLFNFQVKHLVIISVVVLILFMLPISYNFIVSQYDAHITPLLIEDIEKDSYGKGRVLFARYVLEQYDNFNMGKHLFGGSATELYESFTKLLGISSWPHDDFLAVLYMYGGIGLLFYFFYLVVFPFLKTEKKSRNSIVPIILVVVILAITNGFYTYQSNYLFIMALTLLSHRKT
jgi:hypothetical protein